MNDSTNRQFDGLERTLTWPGPSPRRASFRFDAETWAAIDQIAGAHGKRWTQWVRELLAEHPGAVNKRAVIRAAVVRALLDNSVFTITEERAEQLAKPIPALLVCASTLNDEQLAEDLASSTLDGDPVDLFTHSVQTGTDQFGRACIWIQSQLREGMHYAIPLELTVREQATRLANPDWRKKGGAA